MTPARRLPEGLTEDGVATMRALVVRIRTRDGANEKDRRQLDDLVLDSVNAGASLGALALALGLSKPGVQGIVRRGKMREEKR